jgi:erythromycin esterase
LNARVRWLADNSFPVRSIDPEDADFSDLQFLKTIIGNARVVQLGDQTHGDGATIFARGRLIRFLHEQMGFDVLVWEGGFFTCEEMNEAIRSDIPIEEAIRQGLHPISAQSGLLLPVFRYIRSTFNTERPLRQTGLDIQDFLGDPLSFPAALRRLSSRIDTVDPDLASPTERRAFEAIVNTAGRNLTPTPDERRERQEAIARVRGRLKVKSTAAESSRAILLLEKALDNLSSLQELSSLDQKADPPVWKLYRDKQMGENLLWLLNRYYRGQKLIVLVGGGHAAHDIGALYAQAEKSSFTDYRTMGDIVHEHLGRDVYTIQFAAYEGKFGNPFQRPRPLSPPRAGSLEDLWHRTGSQYAFLDLRSLPADHWLRRPVFARPFGYAEQEAMWRDHFDAFLYTDVMFPSSRDGSVPEHVRKQLRAK